MTGICGVAVLTQGPMEETVEATGNIVRSLPRGSNQSGIRAYNERLVLSLVRRQGSLSKADIARMTGLSAQTVSVIMRGLENDRLLLRGKPQRGRVGQPSVPMSLNPDGVYSIGLKIGRRSADFVLIDFVGTIRYRLSIDYAMPLPDEIFAFVTHGKAEIDRRLSSNERDRISGLGIAIPFELWNWADEMGPPRGTLDIWRTIDLRTEISALCHCPVYIQNDATSACGAELVFGKGTNLDDFVYFFVGSFAGGGVVLNGSLFAGRSGNAGALGSMPVPGAGGGTQQLIDCASTVILERMLREASVPLAPDWQRSDDWEIFEPILGDWVLHVACGLAHAIVASCSLIDFSTAIIDGGFPPDVRARLIATTRQAMGGLDLQGIAIPEIVEGSVGSIARALGGATMPLFDRYLIDQNALLKEAS